MRMCDVQGALRAGGVTNPYVVGFVREWAEITQPDAIEVISASDDERLIQEALEAGEICPDWTMTQLLVTWLELSKNGRNLIRLPIPITKSA